MYICIFTCVYIHICICNSKFTYHVPSLARAVRLQGILDSWPVRLGSAMAPKGKDSKKAEKARGPQRDGALGRFGL